MNNKDYTAVKYGNRNCVRVQDRTYPLHGDNRVQPCFKGKPFGYPKKVDHSRERKTPR